MGFVQDSNFSLKFKVELERLMQAKLGEIAILGY